jgi:hypothetical protein
MCSFPFNCFALEFPCGSFQKSSEMKFAGAFGLLIACVNEPFAHRLTLREEGQVELWVETPNGLSASVSLPKISTLCQ